MHEWRAAGSANLCGGAGQDGRPAVARSNWYAGAQALAAALPGCPQLPELDLSFNDIGAHGAEALAESLAANTSVDLRVQVVPSCCTKPNCRACEARTAAHGGEFLDLRPGGGQRGGAVGKAVGDPLHHRAGHGLRTVAAGKAEEPAGGSVEIVGGPLSGQIGQEQHVPGAIGVLILRCPGQRI